MRIGLIADIHGNGIALDVVLAELARERVDEIICLGDVAALGSQPREVLARLRAIGCPVVMGNTDAWLAAWPPARAISPEVFAKTEWCRRNSPLTISHTSAHFRPSSSGRWKMVRRCSVSTALRAHMTTTCARRRPPTHSM